MGYFHKQHHAQDQEMTEFVFKGALPHWSPEGIGEIKKERSEEMREILKDLEKYRGGGRYESKDGLKNQFEIKHW